MLAEMYETVDKARAIVDAYDRITSFKTEVEQIRKSHISNDEKIKKILELHCVSFCDLGMILTAKITL